MCFVQTDGAAACMRACMHAFCAGATPEALTNTSSILGHANAKVESLVKEGRGLVATHTTCLDTIQVGVRLPPRSLLSPPVSCSRQDALWFDEPSGDSRSRRHPLMRFASILAQAA